MSRIPDGLIPDSDFAELFKTEKERKQKELAEQRERLCKKKLPDSEKRRALREGALQLSEVWTEVKNKVLDALFEDVQDTMTELQGEVQPEHFDKVKKVAKFAFLSGQYISELCSLTSYQEVLDLQKGKRVGNLESARVRQAKVEAEKERIKSAVAEIRKTTKRKLNDNEMIARLRKKGVTLGKSQLYKILEKLR